MQTIYLIYQYIINNISIRNIINKYILNNNINTVSKQLTINNLIENSHNDNFTTFTLYDIDFKVKSNLTSIDDLLNFNALKEWCNNFKTTNGIITHGGSVGPVEIQNITYFGKNIGFLYINSNTVINNHSIPSFSLLRNRCVAVLPLFYDNNNNLYAAFVKQFRSPMSELTIEMPAGICDGYNFNGQAAKELKEELNLSIKENDIYWLSQDQATSPGCLNEIISLGVVIVKDFMQQLPEETRNIINGQHSEGEFIKTKIINLNDARHSIKDMKFHATIGLLETLLKNKDLIKDKEDLMNLQL